MWLYQMPLGYSIPEALEIFQEKYRRMGNTESYPTVPLLYVGLP